MTATKILTQNLNRGHEDGPLSQTSSAVLTTSSSFSCSSSGEIGLPRTDEAKPLRADAALPNWKILASRRDALAQVSHALKPAVLVVITPSRMNLSLGYVLDRLELTAEFALEELGRVLNA